MNSVHDYIRHMLDGTLKGNDEFWFAMERPLENVDVSEYRNYVLPLCKLIASTDESYKQQKAYEVIEKIIPEEPGAEVAAILINQAKEDYHWGAAIDLLPKIKIPEGVDLAPLIDIINDENYNNRMAILAMKGVQGPDAENFLLKRLRQGDRNELFMDITDICEALGGTGTLFSLPVLAAKNKTFTAGK